jgi:hypothetical protein
VNGAPGTVNAGNVVAPAGQGITAGQFDEVIQAMRGGLAYSNVHTVTFPAGEIRGQLNDNSAEHERYAQNPNALPVALTKKPARLNAERAFANNPGDFLLSHAVTHAVPSAPTGLTSVFGMGTGVDVDPSTFLDKSSQDRVVFAHLLKG